MMMMMMMMTNHEPTPLPSVVLPYHRYDIMFIIIPSYDTDILQNGLANTKDLVIRARLEILKLHKQQATLSALIGYYYKALVRDTVALKSRGSSNSKRGGRSYEQQFILTYELVRNYNRYNTALENETKNELQ